MLWHRFCFFHWDSTHRCNCAVVLLVSGHPYIAIFAPVFSPTVLAKLNESEVRTRKCPYVELNHTQANSLRLFQSCRSQPPEQLKLLLLIKIGYWLTNSNKYWPWLTNPPSHVLSKNTPSLYITKLSLKRTIYQLQ